MKFHTRNEGERIQVEIDGESVWVWERERERECATGEDDGVPFQNNWVYSVRPIVPLILSGRVMLKEFMQNSNVFLSVSWLCQWPQTAAATSSCLYYLRCRLSEVQTEVKKLGFRMGADVEETTKTPDSYLSTGDQPISHSYPTSSLQA